MNIVLLSYHHRHRLHSTLVIRYHCLLLSIYNFFLCLKCLALFQNQLNLKAICFAAPFYNRVALKSCRVATQQGSGAFKAPPVFFRVRCCRWCWCQAVVGVSDALVCLAVSYSRALPAANFAIYVLFHLAKLLCKYTLSVVAVVIVVLLLLLCAAEKKNRS